MKKILLFLLLFALTALASNEEKVLNIYGPGYIAEHSYNVRYYMAVVGNPDCNPIGHHWTCTDLNGNPLDYIKSSVWDYEVFLDIGDQPFILNARFHYEEHGTHDEKYIYASYVVNVGEPSFSLAKVSTIRNGEWDQNGRKSIYFNIDYDGRSVSSGITDQDFLVDDKTYLDDELLPIEITHTPKTMNVDYVLLRAIMPNHIRLCREYLYLVHWDRRYKSIATQGQTTDIYCGNNFNKGNIFDCDLFLEGVAIGSGHVKLGIGHKDDTNYFNCIADVNYWSHADLYGRPPTCLEQTNVESNYSMLKSCEYSVIDDPIIEGNTSNRQDYNAPAYAVDHAWSVIGFPFIVDYSGYGTTANPFVCINGLYYTSYEAFEDASEYYRSTIWPINLYPTYYLGDSVVLYYGGLKASLRSSNGGGNIPNMFIIKTSSELNYLLLNHNGKDMFDYYYDLYNNTGIYTPKMYAPILD